jgi:hypothetical protein
MPGITAIHECNGKSSARGERFIRQPKDRGSINRILGSLLVACRSAAPDCPDRRQPKNPLALAISSSTIAFVSTPNLRHVRPDASRLSMFACLAVAVPDISVRDGMRRHPPGARQYVMELDGKSRFSEMSEPWLSFHRAIK